MPWLMFVQFGTIIIAYSIGYAFSNEKKKEE